MPASASKTPVDADTARRILVDALGPEAELADLAELTDGYFNACYELGTDGGERYVLKVGPGPHVVTLRYERDIALAEVAAIELVLRHTRVPVPRVVWFDASGDHVPGPAMLLDHVPGVALSSCRASLAPPVAAALDADVAGMLAQIHTVAGDDFGLLAPTAQRFASWPEAFGHLLAMLVDDAGARGVELPVAPDRVRALLAGAHAALAEVTTPRLVLWDSWDGNVFVDPDAGRVTGLIDHERALWGDPLMETAFRTRAHDPAYAAAYGRPLLATPGASVRRLLYDLYLYLVLVVEDAYRDYGNDDLGRWGTLQIRTVTLPALEAALR